MAAPPAKNEHLPVLDVARAVAILLVFLYHGFSIGLYPRELPFTGWHRAWPHSLSSFLLLPAYLGWCGVAIFFVISGFCIHLSHRRSSRKDWTTFFTRRFFRIYPPYLVVVLFFAFAIRNSGVDFHSRHGIDQLLTHLLLIHNNLGPGFIFGVNAALWSIGTEAQLYLLYPLLLLLVARVGWRRTLWITGGIEIGLRTFSFLAGAYGHISDLWFTGCPLLYWFSWTIGAVLAEDYLNRKPLFLGRFPVWPWAVMAVASYFIQALATFDFLFWALTTAAVLARVLALPQPPAFSGWWGRGWQKIGIMSYSIYLLHQPLQSRLGWTVHHYLGFLGRAPTQILAYSLIGAVIVGIAWLFHRLIETPSIALGKLVLRKWHSAGASASKSLSV